MFDYVCFGGVVGSMPASSVVDHGFEPLLGQAKDFKTGISCFSLKHPVLRSMGADWLARSQYDASEWSDCCFSELALKTSSEACWSSIKRTSSHNNVTCSHHDTAVKLLTSR